jgi:malate synthase
VAAQPVPIAPALEIAPPPGAAGHADVLPPAALELLAELHRRFEPVRQARLADRRARQAAFDAGAAPDFRADTRAIRESDWRVADLPEALRDRRVEITGPVEPKMVINAMNSGASCSTSCL